MLSFDVKDFFSKKHNLGVVVYARRSALSPEVFCGLIEKDSFDFFVVSERTTDKADNGELVNYRCSFSFFAAQARLDDAVGIENARQLSTGKWFLTFVSPDNPKDLNFSLPKPVGLRVKMTLSSGKHGALIEGEFLTRDIDFLFGQKRLPAEILYPAEDEIVESLNITTIVKVKGEVGVKYELFSGTTLLQSSIVDSTTGDSLPDDYYELRYPSPTLQHGSEYVIVVSILVGLTVVATTRRRFFTWLIAPTFSPPSTHIYVNPLSITLSSSTNATDYQLRWRRIGASAWNTMPPQPSSNLTFVILPSALDDALVVQNNIEMQARAFNSVVSSVWSTPQTTDIQEPDFTIAWASPAPPNPIVQEFGFPVKQFTINISRTPANSEIINLSYIPTPQSDVVLNFTHRDFSGNPFTGGGASRTRFDFASAATQNPAPTTYLNHRARATSKHGTIQHELTFDVEVKDRFQTISQNSSCLVALQAFDKRRRGTQLHVQTSNAPTVDMIRASGQLNLDLSNPSFAYMPQLILNTTTNTQSFLFNDLVTTRQNLFAQVNYTGIITVVFISSVSQYGATVLGGQNWFAEIYATAWFAGEPILVARKNGASFSPIALNEISVNTLVIDVTTSQNVFCIGGAMPNIATGAAGRAGNGNVFIFAAFLFSGNLLSSNPSLLTLTENYCMEFVGI